MPQKSVEKNTEILTERVSIAEIPEAKSSATYDSHSTVSVITTTHQNPVVEITIATFGKPTTPPPSPPSGESDHLE